MKKPILKYQSSLEEYPDSIVPSKIKIPGWYKKMIACVDKKIINDENGVNNSLKHCFPFLESLTVGYMVNLPCDLYVKDKEGSPYVIWKEGSPISWRNSIAHESLIPVGFAPIEYVWNMCVSFEVPKGYSMLVTHPLNRHDLPFITLSGIIDGGFTVYSNGAFPFYIKKDFDGLIEQGTPIAQIIPFRQENWISKKTEGLVESAKLKQKKSNLLFSGWYKKTFWKKKNYL